MSRGPFICADCKRFTRPSDPGSARCQPCADVLNARLRHEHERYAALGPEERNAIADDVWATVQHNLPPMYRGPR